MAISTIKPFFDGPRTLKGLEWYRALDPADVIVVDTETTGLDPDKDEILSLSIVDGNGEVLFDSLVRPEHRKRWPKAQEIHGIAWADVKDKSELLEMSDEIEAIFAAAKVVVGYNLDYDIDMIQAGGIHTGRLKWLDLMQEYAPIYGKWSERKDDWRWAKLEQCAKHYRYGAFDAHGSLEDAKATAYCYRKIMADPKYEAIIAETEAEAKERARRTKEFREAHKDLYEAHEKAAKAQEKKADKGSDSSGCGCIAAIAIVLFFVYWLFRWLFS